jgi:hypothetical protein
MHKAVRFSVVCAGLLSFALPLPRPAAAWPDDPLLNVPLCTATGSQQFPVIVSDDAGGAIVAWHDPRSGNSDIYAQRISADGTVLWTADGLAICTAANNQYNPAITSDGSGGAIIAWQDPRNGVGNWDIYAQRISAEGVVQWEANGVTLCANTNEQTRAAITADGAGGAIVTWWDYRSGTNYDIYAQRISAGGVVQWEANGVALCTATDDQGYPAIASDGAGGAIVTWHNGSADIYAQRIVAGGTAQWTANGVALCTATGNQHYPAIVSDVAGGAIVTWDDARNGNSDIYAQRILPGGTVQWTANGIALCSATEGQYGPTIAMDGESGAIVTWLDYRSGTSYDIYAQRISAEGAIQWTADGVALSTATGEQSYPQLVPDDLGGAIVAWQDRYAGNWNISAQRISADGAVQWTTDGVAICAATGDQTLPVLVADGASGAIVTWLDYRNSNYDIYAQRVWDDGTTPVLLSLVSADIGTDGVSLTWLAGGSGSGSGVATVYRSPVGGQWTRIGEVAADGTGYLRYTDPIDPTASRMGYRLGIVDAGIEGFYGETWVDLPAREGNVSFALDPVRPNPARGSALTVRFSLPDAATASLELLDVSGRRIATREVGSLGAGRHTLDFGEGQHLAPGLYLVRLQQGTNTRVTRAAVLE